MQHLMRSSRSSAVGARLLSAAADAAPSYPRLLHSRILSACEASLPSQHQNLAVLLTQEELQQRVEQGRVAKPLAQDFNAERGAVVTLYGGAAVDETSGYERLLLVGLGPTAEVDAAALRAATHAAIARFRELRVLAAAIRLPSPDGARPPHCLQDGSCAVDVVARTSLLSNYRFGRYLCDAQTDDAAGGGTLPPELQGVHLQVGGGGEGASVPMVQALRRAAAFADGAVLARDLANERADVATPASIETAARAVAAQFDEAEAGDGRTLHVEVLTRADLEREGMDMFVAVGQGASGAARAPRLVVLRYSGCPAQPGAGAAQPGTGAAGDAAGCVAVIGKGVTFDTGGLNLKPTDFIEDMHMDMGGAAAVLGAMATVSRLRPGVEVVGALALAENAIGPDAYKPHAILRSHAGPSVEVGNTDAEGRLVLADALSYVQQRFAPRAVVDVATLTGACVVALGEYAAGLWSNDDALAAQLQAAGARAAEPVWRMPLLPEHTAELRRGSTAADLKSTGAGRAGGACTAAAFLAQFVRPGVRWAHIDIAGPAMISEARGALPKGGTGFGAQLIAEFLVGEAESAAEG